MATSDDYLYAGFLRGYVEKETDAFRKSLLTNLSKRFEQLAGVTYPYVETKSADD